jgi:hypothetical protein
MAWTYSQSTGDLMDAARSRVAKGYSGHGSGLDNPAMEQVECVGPIPRGEWVIGQFFDDAGGKGPMVAHLTPAPGTETFDRSGFMIHGDNVKGDFSASEGCIVLPHVARAAVMASGDRALIVVN